MGKRQQAAAVQEETLHYISNGVCPSENLKLETSNAAAGALRPCAVLFASLRLL